MATCTVTGFLKDPSETPIASAVVKFNIETPGLDGSSGSSLIGPQELRTTTATDGSWSLDISQNCTGILTIEVPQSGSVPTIVRYTFSLSIPAASSATFESVWADNLQLTPTMSGNIFFNMIFGQLGESQLPPLSPTNFWVGNSLGVALPVQMSGDATIDESGVITVTHATIADNSGSFAGVLTGDVSGGQNSTVVGFVDGKSAASIAQSVNDTQAATASNTPSTIVKRDGSGVFAGSLTGNATNITASSNSSLTTLPSLSLPGSQVSGNIAGTASNITASSNSTLTTLPSLSLPGSQVSGSIAGNAANVTGTVAIANGGTAATTVTTARQSLGAQTVFNGLEDNSLFAVSHNPTTRQFAVTYFAGAAVTVLGTRYTFSPSTVTTAAHANTSGKWFLYYDSTGTLTVSSTVWDLAITAPLALVYYNAVNVASELRNEKHPGVTGMDNHVHEYLHETRGTQLVSGGLASGYTLNANGLANTSYAVSAGSIDDEDLNLPFVAQAQGGANTYRIFYQTGTSGAPLWNWVDQAEGGIYSNGTNVYWNQLTGGSWQLTPKTTNGYLNYWVLVGDAYNAPQIFMIMGTAEYATEALALAATFGAEVPNIGLLTTESVVLYQMTYQRGGFGAPGNIRLVDVTHINANIVTVGSGSPGTVTSVGLTDSTGLFTIVGSPVVTAGNLTLSAFASQAQNAFLAGPSSGSGAAAFRAIVAGDVPTLNQNTSGTASNVTGTVAIANGGTGQTAQTAAFNALSPTTTKGDIIVRDSTNNIRVAIGSNDQVLTADSAQASGLKWAPAGTASPLTTKGDLYSYTSTNARLPVGGYNQMLMPNPNASTGLQWSNMGTPLKNYIQYSDFENNATTGWSLAHTSLTSLIPTSVASADVAFDSTHGGSAANGNLSQSITGTALSGSFSLSVASSAASTAGDLLISQAYTIDASDQAKMMTIGFNFKCSSNPTNLVFSGTSTNSFAIYIYDVHNAAWIQPAGVYAINQASGVGSARAVTFQTPSNMTSFQIAIININASAGAETMVYDDFYVIPQQFNYSAPVTDTGANQWTPTGSWSTNSTYTGKWWRVGDRGFYEVNIALAGAPTSASLTINLPHTIDTSKITNTSALVLRMGDGKALDSGNDGYPLGVYYNTSTSVGVLSDKTVSGSNPVNIDEATSVTQASPFTFGASDSITVSFSAPILGWASNSQMSDSSDTRVVAMQVNQASPTATVINGFSLLKFTTAPSSDTHNAFSTSTGGYTCPLPGYYRVTAGCGVAATYANTQNTQIAVGKNSTSSAVISLGTHIAGAAEGVMYPSGSGTVLCVAGDVLYPLVSSSGTSPTVSSSASTNFFQVERLTGPSQIAASETVSARYFASATSLSGSLVTIVWTTKDFDSHGAMSSGVFTCPVAGKYHVAAALALTGTFVLNNTTVIEIQKNGTAKSNLTRYIAAAVTNDGVDIEDTIDCLAGDTLRIQVSNSGTTPSIVSSNTRNFISIFRVGM